MQIVFVSVQYAILCTVNALHSTQSCATVTRVDIYVVTISDGVTLIDCNYGALRDICSAPMKSPLSVHGALAFHFRTFGRYA